MLGQTSRPRAWRRSRPGWRWPPGCRRWPRGSSAVPHLAGGGDEFGSFLSEVSSRSASRSRPGAARVAEAMQRWEGEGYRDQRLPAPAQPGDARSIPSRCCGSSRATSSASRCWRPRRRSSTRPGGRQRLPRSRQRRAEAQAECRGARQGLLPPPGPSRTGCSPTSPTAAEPGWHSAPPHDIAERARRRLQPAGLRRRPRGRQDPFPPRPRQ